jgi:glycogen synthase
MVGVAVRAAARARTRGRRVRLVHDVHEYVPGVRAHSRRAQLANCGHEKEYLRHADAVLTVSAELAGMLVKRHRLAESPIVVLNAPELPAVPAAAGTGTAAGTAAGTGPGLRECCGLGPDVPLLVYSGAAAHQRGLHTMVAALPMLPGVHVAFVVPSPTAEYVAGLGRTAERLGVADRVHVVGYVEPGQVPGFLASATVGVIPILRFPNHEIALITKYFEYLHAGLPIVVSDVRAMAARTRELGNGEVFAAGDVGEFVAAVRAVVADRERYTEVYRRRPEVLAEYSWQRQAATLLDVYTRLVGPPPPVSSRPQVPAAATATGTVGAPSATAAR